MKVIKSIETNDSILTYSNIAEDEHPIWVSGTSYTALDRVIYQHKIYERIITGAGTTTPDLDQVNWMYLSYTNTGCLITSYLIQVIRSVVFILL